MAAIARIIALAGAVTAYSYSILSPPEQETKTAEQAQAQENDTIEEQPEQPSSPQQGQADIEPQPVPVENNETYCTAIVFAEIETDKDAYRYGENVTVLGRYSALGQEPEDEPGPGQVRITFRNSEGYRFGWHWVKPELSADGCFVEYSYSRFVVRGPTDIGNGVIVDKPGTWTVAADYGGESATTAFEVISANEKTNRTSQHPIQIIGDDDCKANTINALDLLKEKAPNYYNYSARYIGIIECVDSLPNGAAGGMDVWAEPPKYIVVTSYTNDPVWYASTIVHDATHSYLYQRYKAQYSPDEVQYCVYSCKPGEGFATTVQADVLELLGVPDYWIVHAVVNNPWWGEEALFPTTPAQTAEAQRLEEQEEKEGVVYDYVIPPQFTNSSNARQ